MVYSLWLCLFFTSYMPLSEQGIWQGRGLFLTRFLFISILGIQVLLPLSSGHFWCMVATSFVLWTVFIGTLYGRNPSTITAPFVDSSGMQPWCFSFASEDCTAFLAVPSPCVFDALIWADTVTGRLTFVIHFGITWHRSFYVFTSFFRAMSYTIFRCKVSDSGARQGRTSCFARKKSK